MKKIGILSLFLAIGFAACFEKETVTCTATPRTDCICTQEYQPVCGCDEKTYGNACEANCNGITSYTAGRCR